MQIQRTYPGCASTRIYRVNTYYYRVNTYYRTNRCAHVRVLVHLGTRPRGKTGHYSKVVGEKTCLFTMASLSFTESATSEAVSIAIEDAATSKFVTERKGSLRA